MSEAKAMRRYERMPIDELEARSKELSELAKAEQITDGQRISRRRVKTVLEKKKGALTYAREREASAEYHRLFEQGRIKGIRDGEFALNGFAHLMQKGAERQGYDEGYEIGLEQYGRRDAGRSGRRRYS